MDCLIWLSAVDETHKIYVPKSLNVKRYKTKPKETCICILMSNKLDIKQKVLLWMKNVVTP